MIGPNKLDCPRAVSNSLDDQSEISEDLGDSLSLQETPSTNVVKRTILCVFSFFQKAVRAILFFLVGVVLFCVIFPLLALAGFVALVLIMVILILDPSEGLSNEQQNRWTKLVELVSSENIVENE